MIGRGQRGEIDKVTGEMGSRETDRTEEKVTTGEERQEKDKVKDNGDEKEA